MNDSLHYQRTLTRIILALGAIVFTVLLLTLSGNSSLAFGWGLGVLVGVCIFRYRAATVLSLFQRPQEEWASASVKASLVSYAVIIVFASGSLALKRLTPYDLIHPFTFLGGVLLERVVLWVDGFLRPALLQPCAEKEQA